MTLPVGTRFRRRHLVASGLIVIFCLAGIAATVGGGLFRRPLVRVAFNQFAPYVDIGPRGAPVGFAVEMLELAARRAKVNIRWVEIDGSADQAFSEGKADMYPLMTITPERESRFYMSPPWWENQFTLVSTEGREIPDAAAARGKVIATRVGVIKTLSLRLFPGARFVDMTTLEEMETALCERKIDGFFSDVRLLDAQLSRRNRVCAGQALHAVSVPESKLFLGTGSTRAASSANDKIFREIAKLALDGTLSRMASARGIFTPYDTARLKQAVDAETHETQLAWALIVALLVLTLSVIQTNIVRRAKHDSESAQAAAKETQTRFDEFMRHTPTITFIKDEFRRVVYSNEEFCCRWMPAIAADRARDGLGDVPGDGDDDRMAMGAISRQLSRGDAEVLESGNGLEVTETLRGRDGESRHFLVVKFPFQGASGARFLGAVALDVTDRMAAEKELEYHAKNDVLTGLPNRRSFIAELGLALGGSQDRDESLAVAFVDLDGFKRVNDLMGHEAGDDLLKQVAERLKQACREPHMVARLGGDEFTILIRRATRSGVHQTMAGVLNALEESFGVGGRPVSISASIGISLFPEDGSDAQELLRNADSAMYAAKANGKRRIQFWRPQDDEVSPESPETRSALMTLAGIQGDPEAACNAPAAARRS